MSNLPADFDGLIDAYLDGVLTDAGREKFEATLLASAAVRDRFWSLARTHGRIFEAVAQAEPTAIVERADEADTDASDDNITIVHPDEKPPFGKRLAAVVALAAVLAIGAYSAFVHFNSEPTSVEPEPDPIAQDPDTSPNRGRGPAVATLIETAGGGRLVTPHDYPSEGRDYGTGEYRLDTGSAEFMLTSAVNVKLRGDTRMFMHNKSRVSLTRGTAEFVVPQNAIGFTVALPDRTKIVDLGTAFRVAVDKAGDTQVRVSQGEVALVTPGELGVSVLIKTRDAARVVDGRIQTLDDVPTDGPSLTKVLLENASDLTRRYTGKLVVARNFGVTEDYIVGDFVFRGQDQEAVADVAAPGSNYPTTKWVVDFTGDDADDRALESVMKSRRWGRDVQSLLIAGLSSEARYRLYLLTGESVGGAPPVNRRVLTSLKVEDNELLSRSFSIVDFQADGLEDGLGKLPNFRKTAVLLDITGLTAADGTLDIELRTDGPEGANHPTLHGFALVEVGPAASDTPEQENTAPDAAADYESPFVEPAP